MGLINDFGIGQNKKLPAKTGRNLLLIFINSLDTFLFTLRLSTNVF